MTNLFLKVGCVMLEMTHQINNKKTKHILCMALKWFISYMYDYIFLFFFFLSFPYLLGKCKCTTNKAYVSYTRVIRAALIGIINVVLSTL
jgi:hypothetical protein